MFKDCKTNDMHFFKIVLQNNQNNSKNKREVIGFNPVDIKIKDVFKTS